jgi:hypothetical protein
VSLNGSRALGLCGNNRGAISQELKTVPGGRYRIHFSQAGNPNLAGVKPLRVTAADPQQDYFRLHLAPGPGV